MRKTKGFTLVELLVVIAIIALLMGILMPALARVRAIAQRIVCGTNLAGIGKAMLIYANDYEEELPLCGINMSTDFRRNILDWTGGYPTATNPREAAFGTGNGQGNVTACFFALIKYAEATPKSFVCKSDSGVSELNLAKAFGGTVPEGFELIDAWDFGPHPLNPEEPDLHCSYSYHRPFSAYPLSTSSEPGMAVAADPSPWFPHAGQTYKQNNPPSYSAAYPGSSTGSKGPFGSKPPFDPDADTDHIRFGNSIPHQEDGQNVLFLDGHVAFENKSFCGVEEDNIYTFQLKAARPHGDRRVGQLGNPGDVGIVGARKDSYLVMNRTALD